MKIIAKSTYNFIVAFTLTFVAVTGASYASGKLINKITFK